MYNVIVNGGSPFFASYDYYIALSVYGRDATKKKTFAGKVASQVKNLVRDLGEFGLIKPRPWPNPIPLASPHAHAESRKADEEAPAGGATAGAPMASGARAAQLLSRSQMLPEGETLFIGVGVCRPADLGIAHAQAGSRVVALSGDLRPTIARWLETVVTDLRENRSDYHLAVEMKKKTELPPECSDAKLIYKGGA